MIPLFSYLLLGAALFGLGLVGLVIHRQNLIHLLMCIELLLLAINTQFVAFSQALGDLAGQIMVFFILTVAAAETAVGLAILILLYRMRHSVAVSALDELKG